MRAIVARIWRKWLSRRSWKGCFGGASLWGLLGDDAAESVQNLVAIFVG
jgi:hypothetical protein